MNLKKLIPVFLLIVGLFISGCTDIAQTPEAMGEEEIAAQLNAELAKVMDCYQTALLTDDPAAVSELVDVLAAFDGKYGSSLADEFQAFLAEQGAQSRLTDPITDFPPLTDLPIIRDGDVYISGGTNSLAGYLVDWVAPNVTAAHYNHGAILDLDKFDPTNLEAPCFHSAIEKGAGFETAWQWMTKQNVGVMRPVNSLNSSALNAAQSEMDYYCDPANTNMAYGFFENYANVFSMVSKEDNYYWYCTKVVWRIYDELGIDIDSDSSLIDWTTSGLYSIVKTYYDIIYFWNKSKARAALNAHMDEAVDKIVLSEEIYFSPHLIPYYEVTR